MSKLIKYFVGGMFIIVPLLFIGSMVWNYMVFKDCMAHGKAMYQCQAIMSNPSYIAVDDVSNR